MRREIHWLVFGACLLPFNWPLLSILDHPHPLVAYLLTLLGWAGLILVLAQLARLQRARERDRDSD